MTFTIKAIATAAILSLAPAIAGAQTISGGSAFLPRPGVDLGTQLGLGGWTPAPGIGAPAPVQDCGASHAQYLVGHDIAHAPVPAGARVIGPGSFVTADYDPQRLSVDHDASGTISRVYCG